MLNKDQLSERVDEALPNAALLPPISVETLWAFVILGTRTKIRMGISLICMIGNYV